MIVGNLKLTLSYYLKLVKERDTLVPNDMKVLIYEDGVEGSRHVFVSGTATGSPQHVRSLSGPAGQRRGLAKRIRGSPKTSPRRVLTEPPLDEPPNNNSNIYLLYPNQIIIVILQLPKRGTDFLK